MDNSSETLSHVPWTPTDSLNFKPS